MTATVSEIATCPQLDDRPTARDRNAEIGAVLRSSYHEGMINFLESLTRLRRREMISRTTRHVAVPDPYEHWMPLLLITVAGGGITG